jgi:adenine-specific DNA-methyltransferase
VKQVVKYLGSKRILLPSILDAVESVPGVRTVLDLFSGTSRVGHALKATGRRVIANDHNAYAHTLATCYIQSDDTHAPAATRLVTELNALASSTPSAASLSTPDPFTQTYCLDSRFFHPDNGPRIFAVRQAIYDLRLDPELESILLTSLLEAADRVDSTTGVQMAYLKSWAPRALRPLELRLPRLLPRAHAGPGLALNLDALDAAQQWGPRADLVYLDPPYNQHSYLGNYHIWESLIRWDFPPVYGRARKRADVRERRSPFNSRRQCLPALVRLIAAIPPEKPLIVSFSNEGFISRDQMEALLSPRGRLRTLEHDYRRYVGAQIGIYNPAGQKVGAVSHLCNKELLFISEPVARPSGPWPAP